MKKKKGSNQELPVLEAPHVSLTIRACTVCSELHLKLLLSGSNRRTNAMFLGFSKNASCERLGFRHRCVHVGACVCVP